MSVTQEIHASAERSVHIQMINTFFQSNTALQIQTLAQEKLIENLKEEFRVLEEALTLKISELKSNLAVANLVIQSSTNLTADADPLPV